MGPRMLVPESQWPIPWKFQNIDPFDDSDI